MFGEKRFLDYSVFKPPLAHSICINLRKVIRSFGISSPPLPQGKRSLSQLESQYGRAQAQTIVTNCATEIALSGLDYETVHYVSRSLGGDGEGKATVVAVSLFRAVRRFRGRLGEERSRPFRHGGRGAPCRRGEALVIRGNRRPL